MLKEIIRLVFRCFVNVRPYREPANPCILRAKVNSSHAYVQYLFRGSLIRADHNVDVCIYGDSTGEGIDCMSPLPLPSLTHLRVPCCPLSLPSLFFTHFPLTRFYIMLLSPSILPLPHLPSTSLSFLHFLFVLVLPFSMYLFHIYLHDIYFPSFPISHLSLFIIPSQ